MRSIIKIKILLATLLLAACMQSTSVLSTADSPQWVKGEPELYPNFKYLTATGSASRSEQAKARALSNLAKIFEVQIREVSTTLRDTQTSQRDGVETVQKDQRIASSVNLKTDKMVQGARIAEQWQSSADLTYHALAVLDRSQAGNNIRGEMDRLDKETQFSLQQHAGRNDPLLKISDLHTANTLQHDREALQQTLKIIDVRDKGDPARWNLAELDERLQRELRALPVLAVIKSDDIGGLKNILQGAAAEAGFSVAAASSAAYTLAASLDSQAPMLKDDWHWLRATLKIELVAQDGITVIGYKSWPLKVSAGSASQLEARMMKAADQKLKAELLNSVLEFAT
jgi:hypothetical protein